MTSNIKINTRQLVENDLPEADWYVSFGFWHFLRTANPMTFFGDVLCKTRFLAESNFDITAEFAHGQIVGFNFVINWGSVVFWTVKIVRS